MSHLRIESDGLTVTDVSIDGVDIRHQIDALTLSMGPQRIPQLSLSYPCHSVSLGGVEVDVVHFCPQAEDDQL